MTRRLINLPFSLDITEVYPFLGLDEKNLTPQIQELLLNTIHKVSLLAHPRGTYADFVVSQVTQDRIDLVDSKLCILGQETLRHFASSSRITLLAVTLGKQVAAALEELSQKKGSEALFFDAVASAATENLAEQLDSLIVGEIRRKGFFPTARFSPGYSDWDLSWQKALVDSINGDRIGLGVTPYSLLEPIKSITAVIGWSSSPITRNYLPPNRLKPCQGTLSCAHCPLKEHCPSSFSTLDTEQQIP